MPSNTRRKALDIVGVVSVLLDLQEQPAVGRQWHPQTWRLLASHAGANRQGNSYQPD